jgi:hypothetical protein
MHWLIWLIKFKYCNVIHLWRQNWRCQFCTRTKKGCLPPPLVKHMQTLRQVPRSCVKPCPWEKQHLTKAVWEQRKLVWIKKKNQLLEKQTIDLLFYYYKRAWEIQFIKQGGCSPVRLWTKHVDLDSGISSPTVGKDLLAMLQPRKARTLVGGQGG